MLLYLKLVILYFLLVSFGCVFFCSNADASRRLNFRQASILNRSLLSANSEDRARAAFVLGQSKYRPSRFLVRGLLVDSQRSVRLQAGLALMTMGDRHGLSACKAAAQDSHLWIRQYALRALKADVRVSSDNRFAKLGKNTADELWNEVADAYKIEADWWWHRGDYVQLIRCLETVVFFAPDRVEDYSDLAWLEWSDGDDALAVETLKRAISANPDDGDAYFYLAQHYFNTKRYEQAEPVCLKSVEFGRDNLSRKLYAHCLEKLGRLEQAIEQWGNILKQDPNDGAAKRNYERLIKSNSVYRQE